MKPWIIHTSLSLLRSATRLGSRAGAAAATFAAFPTLDSEVETTISLEPQIGNIGRSLDLQTEPAIRHLRGLSWKGDMLSTLYQRPQAPAHERYLFKPLRGSSHAWALELLSTSVRNRKLLDIGAGSGWLARSLRASHPQELVAVEIDTRSHDTLREVYDRVLTEVTSLRGETFDVIVLLDVLEHLPRPMDYLMEVRSLLSPGGLILVSVPNVAHWSVRFPLFFLGRFEYQSLGIMDGSHLHFFSRRGFMNLCNAVPMCQIEQVSASIEPFELALPRWIWDNSMYRALLPVRQTVARALPCLMAYQHLGLLRAMQ